MPSQTVFIVADRSYGEKVFPLARLGHVWLVQSPVNESARNRFYRERMWTGDGSNPMASGITSWRAEDGTSAEDHVLHLLETVDDHHGPYEHDVAWTEIVVVGATLTPELRAEFGELGGTGFIVTPDGFRCHRPNPPRR
jgi:hypothetical protein